MKIKANGVQISEKGIVIVALHIEKYIHIITERSYTLLIKENKKREIQGLRKIKRLNENYIKKGIRIINLEDFIFLPVKQDGGIKKEGKKYEKSKADVYSNQGVEIL
jgi:hypothetical protein